MQWSGLYFVCLALCCIHSTSEPLRMLEDNNANGVRRRRSDEHDGLALSREIFRNITKKLRENIKREGATDKEHLLQSLSLRTGLDKSLRKLDTSTRNPTTSRHNIEDTHHFAPYQEYHHHERHWGPYFEERNLTQFYAHIGAEALLNCRVVMLKDKTVMWLRNTTDTAQLLTVGPAPYAGDSRVAVKFQYPNNWRLSINPVKRIDAGVYMCQISTHPPRTIYANLTVLPPVLTINGDNTHEDKDKYYKAGSSIKLSCVIADEYVSTLKAKTATTVATKPPTTTTAITTTTAEPTTKLSTIFNRIDLMLNKSWSVETTTITSTFSISTTTKSIVELKSTTAVTTLQPVTQPVVNNVYGLLWKKDGKDFNTVTWLNLSATISVTTASQSDSGTYTCHLLNHSQVTIYVHVLTGENQAAVHHDTSNKGSLFWHAERLFFILLPVLLSFLLNVSR